MLRWLLRLFSRRGYTCYECKRWIPRRRGRATVIKRERTQRALGKHWREVTYDVNALHCPECAEKIRPKWITEAKSVGNDPVEAAERLGKEGSE